MKLNYNYDENGYFTGVSEARLDPLATQARGVSQFLLPRNATHVEIPHRPLNDDEQWHFNGALWQVVDRPLEEPYEESPQGEPL